MSSSPQHHSPIARTPEDNSPYDYRNDYYQSSPELGPITPDSVHSDQDMKPDFWAPGTKTRGARTNFFQKLKAVGMPDDDEMDGVHYPVKIRELSYDIGVLRRYRPLSDRYGDLANESPSTRPRKKKSVPISESLASSPDVLEVEPPLGIRRFMPSEDVSPSSEGSESSNWQILGTSDNEESDGEPEGLPYTPDHRLTTLSGTRIPMRNLICLPRTLLRQ